MNEDNPYQGYANYEAPRRSYSADDLGYPDKNAGLLRNPVMATVVLLIGASILGGVILLATPGADEEVLPLIKADTSAVKTLPDQPGGMAIPNRDSTVFDQMDVASFDTTAGKPRVENLLADTPKEIIVEDVIEDAAAPAQEKIIEKVEEVALPSNADLAAVPAKKATPPSNFTKPDKLHPAGSSPETLAFVRSVLEEKSVNTEPAVAAAPTAAAPKTVQAAPAVAAPAPNAALTHYIQLSSIRDAARADKEWTALKARYAAQLATSSHRVQEKNLGAKGIYYRIQAGPFSKADATAKCEAIKAVTPSGCYLVAK